MLHNEAVLSATNGKVLSLARDVPKLIENVLIKSIRKYLISSIYKILSVILSKGAEIGLIVSHIFIFR